MQDRLKELQKKPQQQVIDDDLNVQESDKEDEEEAELEVEETVHSGIPLAAIQLPQQVPSPPPARQKRACVNKPIMQKKLRNK